MDERLTDALARLADYTSQHVLLSAAALALGVAISLPLAVLASRHRRLRVAVLAVASLVQTIPGLALLALFYPLLLGLSALTVKLFGTGVPALGFLPSVLALTVYSMLPILRNGVIGLLGVDAAYLEAADGVGMTARQKLLRVELPLAAPVIMAGIRTAAVWTIGMATLSTTVGQTSLGNFIFSGLQTENWISVLLGCAAVVALALVVDWALGLIEAAAVGRRTTPMVTGLAVLAIGIAAAAMPVGGLHGRAYVIGAKNFSEQFILAELMADRLKATGERVELKQGLGSAVIFRALAGGDIDAYVDYSGTLWTNVLRRSDLLPREAMLDALTAALQERYGVTVLGALGFENAYALAMRPARATEARIATIAELAPQTPHLKLGSDLEFLGRPEWTALKQAYSLSFAEEKSYNPTFMYRAIVDGSVDVISAFSSDGRIAADNLVVLPDVKRAIPAYDAVILISPRRRNDERLRAALAPLIGAIPVERMRQANYMLDRDSDKATARDAARFLAAGAGLVER
ncbi:MAG TPA: ABC transporter permease/substrate-binding protein [Xanthobacteraceae bacterium]|nr:ABC transporter permease/substrate-binding protein [Xanthobacteraceae bacterium]